MGIFTNLTNEGLEETQDRLGGYSAVETDAYTGIIKAAYAGKSAGGAQSVSLIVDIPGQSEYRETIYITSKEGKNYFLNKQDKSKKVPLPGFTAINDICLITTDAELHEQDTEDKVMNIYDADLRKEVPKSVPMITGLLGKEITLGIVKQTVNINEKSGDEYVATEKTRDENYIDKVFHTETKMTVVELRAGATEAKFHDAWVERNKGNTRDKRTIKDGETAGGGRPGKPTGGTPAGDTKPRNSLFGNKS